MKGCLLDYEITGLDYLHDKNVKIDELFFKLGLSKEKIFSKKRIKSKNEINDNEQEDCLEKNEIKRKDDIKHKPSLKRVKNYKEINKLKNILFELLCEQCVLCGDFMIDSVQYSLDQKDVFKADKNGLILQIEKENEFDF